MNSATDSLDSRVFNLVTLAGLTAGTAYCFAMDVRVEDMVGSRRPYYGCVTFSNREEVCGRVQRLTTWPWEPVYEVRTRRADSFVMHVDRGYGDVVRVDIPLQ